MKTLLKLAEMMPYLPPEVKDMVHHVAKDSGQSTDALELHRHTHSEKAKVNELDPASRKSLAYVSYRTQDRDDEIVIPKALKLDEFRKYSSVLVNHNYSLLPVGSDEMIEADDYGIKALTVHADTGAGTLANVVWDLVRQGHLKGRSVGFVPTSFTKPGARDWDHVANQLQSNWKEFDKGRAEKSVSRIITGGVLLEHSFVSVPCNTDAELIGVVKSMNLDGKIVKQLGLEDKAAADPVPCACDECGYVADAVAGSKCPECKTGDMKPKGKEKAIEVRVISKGGPGSGNFGHEGRPGQVGGSGEGGGGDKDSGSSDSKYGSVTPSGYGTGLSVREGSKDSKEIARQVVQEKKPFMLTISPGTEKGKESWGELVSLHASYDDAKAAASAFEKKTGIIPYTSRASDVQSIASAIEDEIGKSKGFHSSAVEKPNPHMPGGSFSACVLIMEGKGHSTESAKKICGALQAESGEKLYDILAEAVIKQKLAVEKAPGIPCICDKCGAPAVCAPGSECSDEDCDGIMQPKKKEKTVPEVKVIRPSPTIKVLYTPPDAELIAKGVGNAVELALSRKTGRIL